MVFIRNLRFSLDEDCNKRDLNIIREFNYIFWVSLLGMVLIQVQQWVIIDGREG